LQLSDPTKCAFAVCANAALESETAKKHESSTTHALTLLQTYSGRRVIVSYYSQRLSRNCQREIVVGSSFPAPKHTQERERRIIRK
jgi:hypothetical protein